ncbi:MAG: multiheme c-type cytochrome, partial [Bradymonadaceae bacterium]
MSADRGDAGDDPDAGDARRTRDAGGPHNEPTTKTVDNPIERAREFYATRPYYQRPIGYSEVPEGLPDLRAETCGSCHEAIYREWKISTHRRAWTQDPQFMAEFAKSRRGGHAGEKSDDVSWMCVTCHTPMINQMERLTIGLRGGDIGEPIYVDNPSFDPKMQDDAITCAACHVRNGTVYGPWGNTDAPHPTAKDPTLRSAKQCTQCHQANAKWPSRNLACFFNTGDQFAKTKYAAEGKRCQSCHMPTVERKLAEDYDRPKRKTRRHW